MIECTTNIDYRAFKKAKIERPWYRTIAPNQIKVMPRQGPHQPKVITFERKGNRVFARCSSVDSPDVECMANHNGRWCFHVAWAVQVLIRKQQLRERKQAA